MSNFLMMVPGQKKKHYGYAVKRENALVKDGAEFGNVEYEIVTEDSDPTSISNWKLENLAVFDMNMVKVDDKEKIKWEEYVVFEFVATRKNDKNEELNVEMVKVGDGDGKVYEKDRDGFGVFGKRDLFGPNIDDDGSIASLVEKGDKDINTPRPAPAPVPVPPPEPELEDIVLRASKVNGDGENNKYDLYFKFPNDEKYHAIVAFLISFEKNVKEMEIVNDKKYSFQPADTTDLIGSQAFHFNKKHEPTIDNNGYFIGTITIDENDNIKDYIGEIEIKTENKDKQDLTSKNIEFVSPE